MNTPKPNGKAALDQPFRPISDAVMRVPAARDKRESMTRVQQTIGLIQQAERSYLTTCQHVAYLMQLMCQVTGGRMQQLTLQAPPGIPYRIEDSDGKTVLFLDPGSALVLVQPEHVLPLVGIFQLPEGEKRVTIGETPVPVEKQADA